MHFDLMLVPGERCFGREMPEAVLWYAGPVRAARPASILGSLDRAGSRYFVSLCCWRPLTHRHFPSINLYFTFVLAALSPGPLFPIGIVVPLFFPFVRHSAAHPSCPKGPWAWGRFELARNSLAKSKTSRPVPGSSPHPQSLFFRTKLSDTMVF